MPSTNPPKYFAYYINITEYERGWGSKPDGICLFETEDKAKAFIKDIYDDLPDEVPDYYVKYETASYIPVSASVLKKIKKDGKMWLNATQDALKEVEKKVKQVKVK